MSPRSAFQRVGRAVLAVPLAALSLASCASVSRCEPLTILVKDKEQRTHLERVPAGLQTTETGYVREIYRELFVQEYWVKDDGGRWHKVSESAWREAQAGQTLQVCEP